MKFSALIAILFTFSLSVKAQEADLTNKSAVPSFNFMPAEILPSYSLKINEPLSFSDKYLLLSITGSILSRCKFQSPMDEFTALAPFDARAFAPVSVSAFEMDLRNNYLLIQKPSLQ